MYFVYCQCVGMQNRWALICRTEYFYRRNHHTMRKNQNTITRKTMYHSQRQPCRAAMLFIRRNVPDRMPDVSANASFCCQQVRFMSHTIGMMRTIWLSCTVESRTSLPIAVVICGNADFSQRTGERMQRNSLTSFNNLTFALKPSSCSSFWPSKSSAKRWPFSWYRFSSNGEDRPEDGGVTPSRPERSRNEFVALILASKSGRDATE